MIINQKTAGPTNITINKNNLEKVHNYKYQGTLLNDKLDYDEQQEKTAKIINCQKSKNSDAWDSQMKY